jgi:hypothetical protein
MFRTACDRSGLDSLHRARDRHDAVSIGPRVLALPERLDPSPRPAGPDRGQQKQLQSTVSFVPFYHVANNPVPPRQEVAKLH